MGNSEMLQNPISRVFIKQIPAASGGFPGGTIK